MLLIGPPGSGKTRQILQSLETVIRADRSEEALLLVPTASMKHHLLNALARRGLMTPVRAVSTLAEFVRDLTPDKREARGAVEARLVRKAIRQTAATGFRAGADSPGLSRRIASLMGEFWAAGADSLQVEPAARTRSQRAFVEVFAEYEDLLARHDLVHHNRRIAGAAARIHRNGLGPVRQVFLDGFDRFTRQQVALLEALAEQAERIVVALPAGLPKYPLQGQRSIQLPPSAEPAPENEVIRAATPQREILEVARRILQSDLPLREHAIVLRSPERYRAAIRDVFEALHIPYRIWERTPASSHGVVRHFMAWLDAIEQNFPGDRTLDALLSPLTPKQFQNELEAFDFSTRERLPGAGLGFFLKAAREFPDQTALFEGLETIADRNGGRYGPCRWKRELLELEPKLLELRAPSEPGDFRRIQDWREALAAQGALRRAIDDTSKLPEFDAREVTLGEFVEALGEVVRATQLRVRDQRHEVVHVLPVLEARQWSVPVAFVCGLADGWFPQRPPHEFLFDTTDREQMQTRGIAIRTTAEKAAEERFLFEVARTRATRRLVLTYPVSDERGKPLARSPLLETYAESEVAPWSEPGDNARPTLPTPTERLPSQLRETVAKRNEHFSVSGIENFRQCPFLYFADSTLRLEGRPPLPEDRLDGAVLGTIVHRTLELWNTKGRNGKGMKIQTLLDEVFSKELANRHLPESYRTERLRLSLLADLVRFSAEQVASTGITGAQDTNFETIGIYRISELDSRPEVRCRIDRFDLVEGRRCIVTDYKYASPARTKQMMGEHRKGELLQLMMYLSALEQDIGCEPAGMALLGLRGRTQYEGVAVDGVGELRPLERDELQELLENARSQAARAVASVLDGAISVDPKDERFCSRMCPFGAVCRVRWPSPEAARRSGPASSP